MSANGLIDEGRARAQLGRGHELLEFVEAQADVERERRPDPPFILQIPAGIPAALRIGVVDRERIGQRHAVDPERQHGRQIADSRLFDAEDEPGAQHLGLADARGRIELQPAREALSDDARGDIIEYQIVVDVGREPHGRVARVERQQRIEAAVLRLKREHSEE